MKKINVVNVKCSGCANTIKSELEKIGIINIEVCFTKDDNSKNRTIRFEGNLDRVKEKLTNLWYPEVGSTKSESILRKAKSFVSCAIWKIK